MLQEALVLAHGALATAQPARHAQRFPPGARPRVLVAEDEPDLRECLRELLSPAYELLTATDGQEAPEVLSREGPVDLLTTDAIMPHLSGTELIAQLKADPARAGPAVLTIGVDDYLTKAFAPAELLAWVQALLARHAVRRQFATLPTEVADGPTSSSAPPSWPAC